MQHIWVWARLFISGLNKHDGVVTALATVVIAWLTYSLATDSARQAEIANGTLRAIEGQLSEMKRQSLMTRTQMQPRLVLSIEVGGPTTGGSRIGSRFLTAAWTNSGPTDPANLKGCVGYGYYPIANDGDLATVDTNCTIEENPITQESINKYIYNSIPVIPSQLEALKAGTHKYVLYGRLQYRDALMDGAPRNLSWCRELRLVPGTGEGRAALLPLSADCGSYQ